IGTFEELLEVLTLNQLGYLRTPIVIFNQNGYYDALIAQLETSVRQGFADASCLALFAAADTAAEAVRALLDFKLPDLPNKIKDAIKYDKKAP
ncbi:MAG: LOG family protein, partial [Clostridia bacterium]|nr:LOG family protein [Clostridia bacterium]